MEFCDVDHGGVQCVDLDHYFAWGKAICGKSVGMFTGCQRYRDVPMFDVSFL